MNTAPVFAPDDRGMMSIRMAIAAAKNTNRLLDKYGKITPKLPLTVPHTLFYGPGGTGKTVRVEESVKLMGCTEEDGTFIRISPDSIKKIEDLIQILNQKLSWDGYLCTNNTTKHENCKCNHKITNPVTPKSSIKPIAVFMDEIHVLPADLQEKLGLILLDFRYQLLTKEGLVTYFFPKFTFFACTTKPGDLIKPLRTRFGNKFSVSYYKDEEMFNIVTRMCNQRGWNVSDEAKIIVSKISQGIAREADNHLTGLFNCWIYNLETGQIEDKNVITKEVALRYIKIQQFTEDGLSYDQVRILKYLRSFYEKGKARGIGVQRICGMLGLDPLRFQDELEPRLSSMNYICSGGRGREITEQGIRYLETTLSKYTDI